jgi:hypothetical protein
MDYCSSEKIGDEWQGPAKALTNEFYSRLPQCDKKIVVVRPQTPNPPAGCFSYAPISV